MKPMAQCGIALISAIFILLVLAVLGAVAVTISTTEQIGSAQDVQSALVYQAARAGMEWGLYTVNFTNGHAGACPATKELKIPAGTAIPAPTLAGIYVTVTCASNVGAPPYTITSTACTQPNAASPYCPNITTPNSLYIERQLEVIF